MFTTARVFTIWSFACVFSVRAGFACGDSPKTLTRPVFKTPARQLTRVLRVGALKALVTVAAHQSTPSAVGCVLFCIYFVTVSSLHMAAILQNGSLDKKTKHCFLWSDLIRFLIGSDLWMCLVYYFFPCNCEHGGVGEPDPFGGN